MGVRERSVPGAAWYLRVRSQFAHIVLLQPAAGVVRVSVRWPIQVGTDVLASPRQQQLLAPRMMPHEAGEVVQTGPAADPAGTGRQAPLDLGGREGGGGGRSGGHGGRAELGSRSPAVCSAAAQRASNISGAGAAATGRPPPHLLICMPCSHWPLGGTRLGARSRLPIGPRGPEPRAQGAERGPPGGPGQVEGVPTRCARLPVGASGSEGTVRTTSSAGTELLPLRGTKLSGFNSAVPRGSKDKRH